MAQVWLVQADAVALSLRDGSVHACITSPPYWGLRLYDGIPPTIWGGEADCPHVWGELLTHNGTNHTDKRRWQHTRNGRDEEQPREKQVAWLRTAVAQGQSCHRCLAWAGCLGLEPVHDCLAWARGQGPCPQCFICHMRVVFAEVWRCLRDDGTLWLNIGDSYNAAGRYGHGTRQGYKQGTKRASAAAQDTHRPSAPSLKPKDLCGLPWRLALALQADGWTLRSEVIWHKPNPMPESVTGRPTKAHEQVFLLSKQETYFFDNDAIREQGPALGHYRQDGHSGGSASVTKLTTAPLVHPGYREKYDNPAGRNSRSVWTLSTEPTPFAHFATFPTTLAERCIRAGTSAHGVCSACGAPWMRQVEYGLPNKETTRGQQAWAHVTGQSDSAGGLPMRPCSTTGWTPSCSCNAPVTAALCLDPFAGSGTVGLAARALGRYAVLCDLSLTYLRDVARERLGLSALAAWEGRPTSTGTTTVDDLPLFGGSPHAHP